MKKLFLMGFVALGLASCVSDKEVAPQTQDQKYTAAFENLVGGKINANVNWGFDDMTVNVIKPDEDAASSRRAAKADRNLWGTSSIPIQVPDNVTTTEEQKVLDYFEKLPTDIERTVNVKWTDFFVYHVHTGTAIVKDANGHDVAVGSQMDELKCYKGANMTDGEHVLNFNSCKNDSYATTEGGSVRPGYKTIGGTLMYNSGTADFSYKNSTDSKEHNEYIIIPGADIDKSLAGYYYVGFDFYGTKNEYQHANNNMDVHRDYVYTDWIVRISPAEYINTKRVFVEDLKDSSLDNLDISDWDFNDAVFDVAFISEQSQVDWKYYDYALITLWAAGGTKALTIGGKEVHELFGQPVSTMINTNANGGVDGLAPVQFRIYYGPADNTATRNALEIVTRVGSTELTAKTGEATQKCAVSTKTKWMKERKQLTGSYTSFKAYVKDNNPEEWYKTVTNESDLY